MTEVLNVIGELCTIASCERSFNLYSRERPWQNLPTRIHFCGPCKGYTQKDGPILRRLPFLIYWPCRLLGRDESRLQSLPGLFLDTPEC